MSKPDGGPAFPTDHSLDDSVTNISGGMSLRDYFAAKALSGLCASDMTIVAGLATDAKCRPTEMLARLSYEWADAMLAERSKP